MNQPAYQLYQKDPAGRFVPVTNGADVNAKDSKGNTPLHYATGGLSLKKIYRGGRQNLVKLLIANGADLNARNNAGWTSRKGKRPR